MKVSSFLWSFHSVTSFPSSQRVFATRTLPGASGIASETSLTSRFYCVDSSSPGFAARNLEHVARLMDPLKCVFVLSGWWRRYFRRAAGWILYRRSFFLNLTGIDAPCAAKVSKVLSVKYRGNKQTYCG